MMASVSDPRLTPVILHYRNSQLGIEMSQHGPLPTDYSLVLRMLSILGVFGIGTAAVLFQDIFRGQGYRDTVVAQTNVGEQSRPIIEFNTPTGPQPAVASRIKEENKYFETGSHLPIRQWPDRSEVQIAAMAELWVWPSLLAAFSMLFLFIGLTRPLAADRRAKCWQPLPERGQRGDARILAIEKGRDRQGRMQ